MITAAKYRCCFYLVLFFTGYSLRAEAPEALFASGQEAFNRGDYPAAGKKFSSLLKFYPVFGKADAAYYLSALSDYYRQNYATCISKLLLFKTHYPVSEYNSGIEYWLGVAYYHLDLYERAAAHFQKQILDPGKSYYVYALYYKGLSLLKMGNREAAEADFYAIVSTDYLPGAPAEKEYVANLLYQYGTWEFSQGNYQAALIYFRKLLIAYSAYSFACNVSFYIAECYYLLGDYDTAAQRYKNALALFPATMHKEICFFRLVEIYYVLERFADALEYLLLYEADFPVGKFNNRIIRYKAPAFFRLQLYHEAIPCYIQLLETARAEERQLIFYNLGLAAQNTDQYALAEQCFHFSLNCADPVIAENSLLKLAGIYREQELDREVIRTLEVFRDRFPGSLSGEQVLRSLALNYMKTGDRESALQTWNQLISEFSQSFYRDEYFLRRGLSYIQLARYKEALEDLQALVALYPGSRYAAEANYNIGYIYTLKYEYTRAFEYYDNALAFEPEEELRVRILLAQGINYYNLGAYEQALAVCNTVLPGKTCSKWTSMLLYCLGMCHLKLGAKEKALESFSLAGQCLEANPGVLDDRYWNRRREGNQG